MKKCCFALISVCHFVISCSGASQAYGIKNIPKEVLEPCLDQNGRIAEKGKPWNHSDVGISGSNIGPSARIVELCKTKNDEWVLVCEKGGYGISYILVRSKLDKNKKWSKPQIEESTYLPKPQCE